MEGFEEGGCARTKNRMSSARGSAWGWVEKADVDAGEPAELEEVEADNGVRGYSAVVDGREDVLAESVVAAQPEAVERYDERGTKVFLGF